MKDKKSDGGGALSASNFSPEGLQANQRLGGEAAQPQEPQEEELGMSPGEPSEGDQDGSMSIGSESAAAEKRGF